jgi:DNA-directed RNA polymerase subunit M/transcription elongation factor TFIIS
MLFFYLNITVLIIIIDKKYNMAHVIKSIEGSRKKGRKIIKRAIANNTRINELTKEEKATISKYLEQGCLNYGVILSMNHNLFDSTEHLSIYDAAVRRMSLLLNEKSDVYQEKLIDCIINDINSAKEYCEESNEEYSRVLNYMLKNLKELPMISPQNIAPEAYKKDLDMIKIRTGIKVQLRTSPFKTCPRCKRKTVTFQEIQFRCADEAADVRHECIKCKHRW